jgi:hypothetical protein
VADFGRLACILRLFAGIPWCIHRKNLRLEVECPPIFDGEAVKLAFVHVSVLFGLHTGLQEPPFVLAANFVAKGIQSIKSSVKCAHATLAGRLPVESAFALLGAMCGAALMWVSWSQRGKYNTQWKKRWFILHNRARNYELEYLTATREAKGSIAMVGMTVTTAPDHTLVLEPSDRSRIYYLKASDRGEQKRWKYILQFAARKAVPDLNANAMLHLTFEGAFAHTRQHFGMYDLYYSAGNEVTQVM